MAETNPQRFARVMDLFHAAAELPREEGRRFVVAHCGDDAWLRDQVLGLLASTVSQDTESFLARAQHAVESAAEKVPLEVLGSDEELPSVVDSYRIVRKLGSGHFGSVYLAEQTRPVQRRVALKVIRPGMDSREVVARFAAGRQVLALLDHPGVAKVFDAGCTPQGRPYFAMEYVDGKPIVQFCQERRLALRARIDLFMRLCDAVQHAHQKGVIHRDLSAGNVLVSERDDAPEPKVIDFGIAKSLVEQPHGQTLQTAETQVFGTPEYMSPEQARSSGHDIDTRTDVYALGVLLYQLLCGELPIASALVRGVPAVEMQSAIARHEPGPPSRRVSSSATMKSLSKELDWITLKALEKDRRRRYGSARELSDDLLRYLRNEPVLAGPPSTTYRVCKFVQRYRGAVIAVASLLAMLLIGLAGMTYLWFEAKRQERIAEGQSLTAETARAGEARKASEAEQQRDVANKARRRAELTAAFMSDMLKGVGPSVALGRDITMLKEMVDTAARRIEMGNLQDAPDAELQLRATIGELYRELEALDDSQRMLDPALELARRLHPGDHSDLAAVLNVIGDLRLVRGELAEAESAYRESLQMLKRLFPGDHQETAVGLHDLAALLQVRGDLEQAGLHLEESLSMIKRLFPGDHQEVARILNSFAGLLHARGDLAGAESHYREVVSMKKLLTSGDHPELAICLNDFATLLPARGKHIEAEALTREALDMTRRLLPGHSRTIAVLLGNLAQRLLDRADFAKAEELFRESLEMMRRLFPGDHQDVAAALSNLAGLLHECGDIEGAERAFRESLAMMRRLFPGDHSSVAVVMQRLGSALQDRGDLVAAEHFVRESLEMVRRIHRGDHPAVAIALDNLAGLLQDGGDLGGAEALFRESLEMSRRLYPADHSDVATGLSNLGLVLQARGQFEEAEMLLQQSLEVTTRLFSSDHPEVAADLNNLAGVLQDRGNLAGAEALLRQSTEMMRRLFPGGHAELATSLNNLGAALRARGNVEEAEECYRAALAMRQQVLDAGHPDTLASIYNLVELLLTTGRYVEALPLALSAIEDGSSRFGGTHVSTSRAMTQIVALYEAWDRDEPGKGHAAKAAERMSKLHEMPTPDFKPNGKR